MVSGACSENVKHFHFQHGSKELQYTSNERLAKIRCGNKSHKAYEDTNTAQPKSKDKQSKDTMV